MPTIIANVRRSRRICTNSFSSTAMKRAQEMADIQGSRIIIGCLVHELDEHVFEAGFDRCPMQFLLRALRTNRALQSLSVGAAHVQSASEGHHCGNARACAQSLRKGGQIRA